MDCEQAARICAVFQKQEMKPSHERAAEYLEMFRDEQYLELSTALKTETPQAIVEICRMAAKYEGVHQLKFIRELLGDEE